MFSKPYLGTARDVLGLAPFLSSLTRSFKSRGQGLIIIFTILLNINEVMKIFLTSVNPYEYGDLNWRVAIKLIYRNMVQESRHDDHYNIGWWGWCLQTWLWSCWPREEYLVCQLDCLVSQFGGTIGIFFGISLMEFIFALEWILSATFAMSAKKK